VTVPADTVEFASGELWALGATGISEEGDADLASTVRLVAGFPSVEAAKEAGASIGENDIASRHGWVVHVVVVEGSEWMDTWRDHFEPFVTEQALVMPAWRPDAAAPPEAQGRTRTRIDLDPGHAFGSGSHPSTRLALDLTIESVRRTHAPQVLDVGCGSGILTVAAALSGAALVWAIDIETEARRATADNAHRNGVESAISVSDRSVHDITDTFDVVVANILAPTLR
jgi:ribosomal protein L11 methyltransferase